VAKKRKTVARDGGKIKPISITEQRRTDNSLTKKHDKLRRGYEVHLENMDWIEHSYDDGYIDFSVVFTDGKVFSVSYSLHAVLEGAQFSDMSTDDDEVLRTYYRRPRKD
jgi:hypothetical protein